MLDIGFSQSLLLALLGASIGGFIAKKLKLQPLIGYIFSGVILGSFITSSESIYKLAEIGIILLLFSLGIELSITRLGRVIKTALIGATTQIVLVSLLGFVFFTKVGFDSASAIIISLGLSLSSTAVVVKILSDRGERDTIHGNIMTGWLLLQDLAVIPMVILINSLAGGTGNWVVSSALSLLKAAYVLVVIIVLGRHIFPRLIHKVASVNSRELLLLSTLALALGTAYLTSLMGVSPALGAFLAGIVISESVENHAIFTEIRPLRNLFVAIFFVTLGFMVKPQVLMENIWLIMGIFILIMFVKAMINLLVSLMVGLKGKIPVAISLGLNQVGEFSFVIYSQAVILGLLSPERASVVIASVLMTLLATPFMFKSVVPVWRRLKDLTLRFPMLNKMFLGGDSKIAVRSEFSNHIIICGYGRVGGWVGKALFDLGLPFVIIDYDQEVVNHLRKEGFSVVFGDPAEPEVLEAAGIKEAKAIVLAIPDRVSQEMLIGNVQTCAPHVKIISRVHLDEDWERLKLFKIHKIVQPEFEAAIVITRTILVALGKSKDEINERIKKLRISHSLK